MMTADTSLLDTAREDASAPSSGFQVSAALRRSSGTVFVARRGETLVSPQRNCVDVGAIAALAADGAATRANRKGATLRSSAVARLPGAFEASHRTKV